MNRYNVSMNNTKNQKWQTKKKFSEKAINLENINNRLMLGMTDAN